MSWVSSLSRSKAASLYRAASRSPTLSGLSSLSRIRSSWSSVWSRYSSIASKPLCSQSARSRRRARACCGQRGRRPGRPAGVSPSSASAFSRTKSITSLRSAGPARMSILFTMNTIFLPHSRIRSRNSRSLSVNGRSAEVTKSTRSARGTKSRVSSSCWRMIALVPGVSTTVSSRSSSAGWVRSSRYASSRVLGHLGAVAEEVDAVGGGRDALGEHPLAEERVDEAGLAGIELAGDHQQEEPRELIGRLAEALEIGGLNVRAEGLQGAREAPQQLLFPGPQVLLAVREERSPPEQPPDHLEIMPVSCRVRGAPPSRPASPPP